MAHQKFGSFADEFLSYAQKQMGVHIFMVIGYKNEKGEIVRAKYGLSLPHLSRTLIALFIRLETPQPHPAHPKFLPQFNKVGEEVWKEWDCFLDKANGQFLSEMPCYLC
jgi:hypothetical protein